jgi:hypothetical protein
VTFPVTPKRREQNVIDLTLNKAEGLLRPLAHVKGC